MHIDVRVSGDSAPVQAVLGGAKTPAQRYNQRRHNINGFLP